MTARMYVGVDLGTSTTLVAYLRDGKVALEPDPQNPESSFTPSVVLLAPDGKAEAVGEVACNQLVTDGPRIVLEPKRHIGTDKKFPEGSPHVFAWEVLAEILYYRLEPFGALAPTLAADTVSVMVAVPAYYGDVERKRTVEAFDRRGAGWRNCPRPRRCALNWRDWWTSRSPPLCVTRPSHRGCSRGRRSWSSIWAAARST